MEIVAVSKLKDTKINNIEYEIWLITLYNANIMDPLQTRRVLTLPKCWRKGRVYKSVYATYRIRGFVTYENKGKARTQDFQASLPQVQK